MRRHFKHAGMYLLPKQIYKNLTYLSYLTVFRSPIAHIENIIAPVFLMIGKLRRDQKSLTMRPMVKEAKRRNKRFWRAVDYRDTLHLKLPNLLRDKLCASQSYAKSSLCVVRVSKLIYYSASIVLCSLMKSLIYLQKCELYY